MNEKFDYVAFFICNYERAVHYAQGIVGNEDESRDLVSEVFLHFLEMEKKLDKDRNVTALFFQMVHKRCLDFLRRLQCYMEIEKRIKQTADCYSDDEFSALCHRELFRIIGESLERFPESSRTAFYDIRIYGRSYKDVAKDLGMSWRTLESQLKVATDCVREQVLSMYG